MVIAMKRTVTRGITLVLLLACISVASATLVSNGGFESQSGTIFGITGNGLTGWNVDAGSVDLIEPYQTWIPFSGLRSIDLSGNERGTISQSIVTDSGKSYKLSFAMAGNPELGNTEKILEVYWDDNLVGTYKFTPTDWPRPGQWQTHEITLQAASDSTSIKFKDATTAGDIRCGVALDSIDVEEQQVIPTPEFPTMALPAALIVGMLGAILFIQRTKEN